MGISVFDIILVNIRGFPSFLLVWGGAKIGISNFDIILLNIRGFPSLLLVGEGLLHSLNCNPQEKILFVAFQAVTVMRK